MSDPSVSTANTTKDVLFSKNMKAMFKGIAKIDRRKFNTAYQRERRKRMKLDQMKKKQDSKMIRYAAVMARNRYAPEEIFDWFVDRVSEFQKNRDFVSIGKLINSNTAVQKVYGTTCEREKPGDRFCNQLAITRMGKGRPGVVSSYVTMNVLLFVLLKK